MELRYTGADYPSGNKTYPIYVDRSGMAFIHDPHKELSLERKYVAAFLKGQQRSGLGVIPGGAIQAAAAAANFIPVVGPIVSTVISLVGSLFGGGDPTALSILIGQIVQLREQIAQINVALGNNDTFVVPDGFDPTDKNTWRDLVDGIVEEVLGTTEAGIQGARRKDYYAAISALQKLLTTAQGALHDAQLSAAIEARLQPAAAAGGVTPTPAQDVPPAAAPDTSGTTSPSLATLWPMLALIAGAVILVRRAS